MSVKTKFWETIQFEIGYSFSFSNCASNIYFISECEIFIFENNKKIECIFLLNLAKSARVTLKNGKIALFFIVR